MERGIDLIIWAVLFLLLFGGSLIKAFLRWRAEQREEAKKPLLERKRHSFMEELKKTLEGMLTEEGPEIVIEEVPERRRPKRRRVREEAPIPVAKPEERVVQPKRVRLTPLTEPPKPKTLPRKIPLSEILPEDELHRAIVMSEVLGPPRSRRRSHRLF